MYLVIQIIASQINPVNVFYIINLIDTLRCRRIY